MSVIQCPVDECSYLIKTTSKSFSYEWKVHEASQLAKLDSSCERVSPTFAASNSRQQLWTMTLELHTASDEAKTEYLSLYLYLDKKSWCDASASFSFQLVSDKTKHNYDDFDFSPGRGTGDRKFLKLSNLKDVTSPGDTLIIRCSIKIIPQLSDNAAGPPSELATDLLNIRSENTHADVTLVADDGQTFEANRCILNVRSNVFQGMFASQMKESCARVIKISGIRSEVLSEMLTYIYTDSAPNIYNFANELLVAADMYGLERLVKMCETELTEDMIAENVVDTLQVADKCSRAYLKDIALKYIADNSSAVVNAEGYKNLNDAKLLKEITAAIISSQSKAIEPPKKRQKSY